MGRFRNHGLASRCLGPLGQRSLIHKFPVTSSGDSLSLSPVSALRPATADRFFIGVQGENRTHNLRFWRPALCQLSYLHKICPFRLCLHANTEIHVCESPHRGDQARHIPTEHAHPESAGRAKTHPKWGGGVKLHPLQSSARKTPVERQSPPAYFLGTSTSARSLTKGRQLLLLAALAWGKNVKKGPELLQASGPRSGGFLARAYDDAPPGSD